MIDPSSVAHPPWGWIRLLLAMIVLITVIFACSIYANLSFLVTNKEDLQYLPPFEPGVDANANSHLGAEYFNIARALRAGKGFADPFPKLASGPTAWMPPVLPTILAGLLWVCDGDQDLVMAVVVFLQVFVLIGTGLLVLALVRQTASRLGTVAAVVVFLLVVLCDFRLWFQFTHDCWLVLLALDLLVAGLCWWRPLHRWQTATVWGLFGGCCALINPLVALAWGLLSLEVGVRHRSWSRLALAVLVAGLTLLPWTVRNYGVFGRLIPVKPNLSYELYQSQCLQPDGLLQYTTFVNHHPINTSTQERQEYKALGETAYLDHKREQFWQAVGEDPQNFVERVAERFLGATLWYEPFNRTEKTKRPWVLWLSRLTHPLPFLALALLMFTAIVKRLPRAQWTVIGVYLLYLLPYIGVSYYERYAIPLLGVKVLLVIWAADQVLSLLFKKQRTKSEPLSHSRQSADRARLGLAVPVSP